MICGTLRNNLVPSLYYFTNLPVNSFQGLNPGKAIAEIKKMMATYKEKAAVA